DIDANDTVTLSVSAEPAEFVWTGALAEDRDEAALDALIGQLTTGSQFVLKNIDPVLGTAGWQYNADEVNLDALGAGETLTFTYTVTATDQYGASSSDKVTITLRGTND